VVRQTGKLWLTSALSAEVAELQQIQNRLTAKKEK
jgi:hypothetical protein